uniref:H/ACA ribonucleoprotein complex non-core subunit NAF1 n=1 Tax=Plectus sambesii TaxID=2011161 RepID=A0A914VHJ3_9BILA
MSLVCYEVSSGSDGEADNDDRVPKKAVTSRPKCGFRIDPTIWQTTRQLVDDVCADMGEPSLLSTIKCEPEWTLDMAYRDPNEISLSEDESDAEVRSDDGSDVAVHSESLNDNDSQDSDAEFERILSIARQKRLSSKPTDELSKGDRRDIPRIKGELLPSELPPIEKLCIHVEERVPLQRIGAVSSFVDCLAIVQSDPGMAALDIDTVLFDKERNSIGSVFEVFGPVPRPLYSIRFNSDEDAAQSGLAVGAPIFCAPTEVQWTKTVFTDALRKMKGTDASWKDNDECPDNEQDFSDDEEERRHRSRRRRGGGADADSSQSPSTAQTRGGKRNHRGDCLRGRGGGPGGDRGGGRGGGRGRGGRGHGRGQGYPVFPTPNNAPPAGPRMAWPPSAQTNYTHYFFNQPPVVSPQNQTWAPPPIRQPTNPGIVDTRLMHE